MADKTIHGAVDVRKTASARTINIRPDTGVDWLLRTVLPLLLSDAQRERQAAALREHPPIESMQMMCDNYVLARLATTLRQTRDELVHAIRVEQRWGSDAHADSTLLQFGGDASFRSVLFPHLDEVSAYVARVAPDRGVGPLLRECVALGVQLVAVCHDNARKEPSAGEFSSLMTAYDNALVVLAETARGGRRVVAEPSETERPGYWTETTRKPSGADGYRAVFNDGGRTHRCAHVHQTSTGAERCSRLLSRRAARGELSRIA